MTLLEVIEGLDCLPEEATIYARQPWSCESIAIVDNEEEEGGAPESARPMHLKYFIEVAIAREFLEDWENSVDHSTTSVQRCERIIRYAEDDA